MTSLVAELLYSAGELKKEDIPSKIEKSRHSIEDIKIEVQENLKTWYVDFIPQYVKLDNLSRKLNVADKEFEVLANHVETEIKPQMCGTIAEFHDMLEDLKKIKALKRAVSALINIHNYLDAAQESLAQMAYLDASKNLVEVQRVYDSQGRKHQCQPELYSAMHTDMYVTMERVMVRLNEIWHKKIVIRQNAEHKNFEFQTTLVIDTTSSEDLDSLLQSIENLGHLKSCLKDISSSLLRLALEPVLLQKSVAEKLINNDGQETIVLSILSESPVLSEMFVTLTEVFTFLHHTLGRRNTVPVKNNRDGNGVSIMKNLGSILSKDFCNLLIEKCLKPAVPSQSRQLDEFRKIVDDAVNLHNLLLQFEFLEPEGNALLNFIQNVDILPANRMAQDILRRARNFMKEDLHKTIIVGSQEDVAISLNKGAGDFNEMARTKGLSKSSFLFPRCQISDFTRTLAKLMNEVMQEAKKTSSYSARLYYTVRNICELYCAVVPVYHKEEIETLPQQTAIHHNNCMYIAHCLLTLGGSYELVLPSSVPVTFVDLVPELRKIGAEAFLAQMRRQRQQLLVSLQEEAVFRNFACDEGNFPKAEKAVHQCLCQLGLLKKVWSDVLPVEVYFKAIGTLLNTCLEEIILNITSMEDISATASAQLDSVFAIILKQAPSLFTLSPLDKSDCIHLYVRKWFKFQELQLVLSAGMQEIVDRWSSGKGPLATHFTADEVKHLIRALFQNTERRAAALGRIH